MGADQGLSPCLTPGGTVGGFTPTPRERGQKARLGSESQVSLEVLMALRRLQEENDNLQQENKRLRAMVPEDGPIAIELTPSSTDKTDASSTDSKSDMTDKAEMGEVDVQMGEVDKADDQLVEAAAVVEVLPGATVQTTTDLARVDVGMSC